MCILQEALSSHIQQMLCLVSFIVLGLTVLIITSWELVVLSYTCKYLHHGTSHHHMVHPNRTVSQAQGNTQQLQMMSVSPGYILLSPHHQPPPPHTVSSLTVDNKENLDIKFTKMEVLFFRSFDKNIRFKFNLYNRTDKHSNRTLQAWLPSYQAVRSIKLLTD